MRTSFEIASSTGSYDVRIAPGAMDEVLAQSSEAIFVADAFFGERLKSAGLDPILISADERAKSLDRMSDLILAMRKRGATRATKLVAIGGGVVQDAASFAASVYMRGIDWVYAPTTLLSMTDSCIGGKSSINVGGYKNIVGTIHPPSEVIIDPSLAQTLSSEQVAAGLCEAAKIALCRGPETLDRYFELAPGKRSDPAALTDVIALSLQAKKWFIEIDEFDRAERLLLNFGHTFGHALESASEFTISHGIAVGMGMLTAFHFGEAQGRNYARAPNVAAFRNHVAELVGSAGEYGPSPVPMPLPALLDAFRADKKHQAAQFAFILPTEDGRIERVMLPRNEQVTAAVERAFSTMLEQWHARAAV